MNKFLDIEHEKIFVTTDKLNQIYNYMTYKYI